MSRRPRPSSRPAMFGGSPARAGLLVAALAAGVAAYLWWASPERRIARILTAVDTAFSHEEPGTGLEALSAVAALQGHLAPDVAIDTGRGSGPIAGRQEVISIAARVRAGTPMMRIQWFDTAIDLENDTRGSVTSTAQVTTSNASGQEVVEVHEVEARVEKRDGRWVVTTARRQPEREDAP